MLYDYSSNPTKGLASWNNYPKATKGYGYGKGHLVVISNYQPQTQITDHITTNLPLV